MCSAVRVDASSLLSWDTNLVLVHKCLQHGKDGGVVMLPVSYPSISEFGTEQPFFMYGFIASDFPKRRIFERVCPNLVTLVVREE